MTAAGCRLSAKSAAGGSGFPTGGGLLLENKHMDKNATAHQIVLDVLTLRGPDPNGGPGRMVTADPRLFMSAERLALAKRFARMVPAGTSVLTARRVADAIAPFLATNRNG